jgi:hypothetical protein
VAGNVSADFGFSGASDGNVNIINNSLTPGNTTTISASVFAEHDINIINFGGSTTNLNISGTLTVGPTIGFSDVNIFSGGNLQIAAVNATGLDDDIFIQAMGTKVGFNGPMVAGEDFDYIGFNATTKLLPSAVITVGRDFFASVLNFTGVNAAGVPYLNAAEKPAAQIIGNFIQFVAYGSINGPIAGNTAWLDNAMQIKALYPAIPIFFDISAIGGGFQAINVGFTGDAVVTSGITRTPFDIVGLTSSVLLPPPLIGNGGSQMILNATGNMDINGNGAPFLLAPNAFEFPGGIAFKAGGYISQNVPIYNAWTTFALPFQGIFFEAPTIIASSYQATNGNSWINYSSYPLTGPSTAYQITQPLPGLFQFVNNQNAVHYNVYSKESVGGAICATPNPPAPWPPAGC